MASITVSYIAVTGNPFTAADFNGLWAGATITLANAEVTTAKVADDAITRDKIAPNVAGTGMTQNLDGSLSPTRALTGGVTSQALASSDITFTAGTSKQTQKITGTAGAALSLIAATASATEGDVFTILFSAVALTSTNTITVKSGASALLTFNETGTLNGFVDLIFDGTAWIVQRTLTSLS
jgi:hypothetical protein